MYDDDDIFYTELSADEDDDDEDNEDNDESEDTLDQISDDEVFMAASFDGDADKTFGNPAGSSYGHSIDLDKLTDEQRDLYDSEYYGNIDNGL